MESFFGIPGLGSFTIEKSDWDEDDILELVDVKTEKVVLRVGTANCNDYYPYFVAEFDPTAMAANA